MNEDTLPFEIRKKVLCIKDELAYIGRYMTSISPKLSKFRELEQKKESLRKELNDIHHQYKVTKTVGTNPIKMKKFDERFSDYVGVIGTNRDKVIDKSGQTVRTNQFTKR